MVVENPEKLGALFPSMYLRHDVFDVLHRLKQEYDVVLASASCNEEVALAMDYLQKQGFRFDGVYANDKVKTAFTGAREKDLSRVYADFRIAPSDIAKKVVNVEDVNIDAEVQKELEELANGARLISYSYFTLPHWSFSMVVPVNGNVPVTILVPRMNQEQNPVMDLGVVQSVIDELCRLGAGDFLIGYERFEMRGIKKLQADIARPGILGGSEGKRAATYRYLAVNREEFPKGQAIKAFYR